MKEELLLMPRIEAIGIISGRANNVCVYNDCYIFIEIFDILFNFENE
jgi:hypothetical protein